jgi:small subunit ribosomal protein S16
MPTKIRLQRKGKKGQPFYHIIIADGRAPREGRFIERIGTYNPLTRPADIDINFDKALSWLQSGAQPTDTVKAILAYKGVLYKNHLAKGVKKGALTAEQAEEKFGAWLKEKQEKISRKANEFNLGKKEAAKKQLAYETEVNEAKAKAIAKKLAKEAEAEAAKHDDQPVDETVSPAGEETTEPAGEAGESGEK